MFTRLRSSSLGGLIDIAGKRPETNRSPPSGTKNNTLQSVRLKHATTVSSPLSGSFINLQNPPPSPAQIKHDQALNESKKALTEIIESLQQTSRSDLNQTRALLATMVAILSDSSGCKDCMRENAGFLTLVTVLASLTPPSNISESPLLISTEHDQGILGLPNTTDEALNAPSVELSHQKRNSSSDVVEINKRSVSTPSSRPNIFSEEDRDSLVELVFKCLSLSLMNDRENQHFFSTSVGYKLVLDAIRLSSLIPNSGAGETFSNRERWKQNRLCKIERLFGVLFAFIVSDFSYTNLFTALRISVQSEEENKNLKAIGKTLGIATPDFSPSKTCKDPSDKLEKIFEILRQRIYDRKAHLRVEVADAVILYFSLHADLFRSSKFDPSLLEVDQEFYLITLKSIELLASVSRQNQITLNSIELTAILLERMVPPRQASLTDPSGEEINQDRPSFPSAGLEIWPTEDIYEGYKNIPTRTLVAHRRRCREAERALIQILLEVGSSAREARALFRQAVMSSDCSDRASEALNEDFLDLILLGMQSSSRPPFIHFCPSEGSDGFAFLKSLGNIPFPPLQGNGWTFATWIQIESFGSYPNNHVEILTLSDSAQNCFVRISISDCSKVTVQTHKHESSLKLTSPDRMNTLESSKFGLSNSDTTGPSQHASKLDTLVEFNSVNFELNRFYHFAITQKPATKTSPSTVSLYIDGERVDTVPAIWPKSPGLHPVSAYFGHYESQPLRASQNWSTKISRGSEISVIPENAIKITGDGSYMPSTPKHTNPRWNLGGCWMFSQCLVDEMLFVQSTLGPKIFSCFQDALGSFQTYTSSTLLNLRIDQINHEAAQAIKSGLNTNQTPMRKRLTPGNNYINGSTLNNSPLIRAIKEAASVFVPQTSLYFALSAKNGISLDQRDTLNEEIPMRSARLSASSRNSYKGNENLFSHMQQVYSPVTPQFFDRKIFDSCALPFGPTSSAFGPTFANAVLNAAIPNFKARSYHFYPDIHPNSSSSLPSSLHSSTTSSLTSAIAAGESKPHKHSNIVLRLVGDVALCSPRGLDDSIWKASGSIYLIRLIDLASTEKQLISALKIFFEAISHNWRLSEDAEKIQAYETIALILRSKTNLITLAVHRILMRLAGILINGPSIGSSPACKNLIKLPEHSSAFSPALKDHISGAKVDDCPVDNGLRESVIANPLAFRFLLLDFDLWASAEASIQLKHFESLRVMIETSIYSRFNIKRIGKMNIIPKMLRALRSRQFSLTSDRLFQTNSPVMTAFIRLLSCMLKIQFTSESIRHLASYLTSSLSPHDSMKKISHFPSYPQHEAVSPTTVPEKTLHPTDTMVFDGLRVPNSFIQPFSTSVSLEEPLMVLVAFHDLLMSANDQESLHYITRFLKAINGPRWLLMFFRSDSSTEVILYSLRILTRLFQTQDHNWLHHFKTSLAGFTILRSVLSKFCFRSPSILVTVLSLASKIDVRTVPIFFGGVNKTSTVSIMASDAEFPSIVRCMEGTPDKILTPEILPIIFKLIGPAYTKRNPPDLLISVHVMEWLSSKMAVEVWNETMGNSEMIRQWASAVVLLFCLPHQGGIQKNVQNTPLESAFDATNSAFEMKILGSFPLCLANRLDQDLEVNSSALKSTENFPSIQTVPPSIADSNSKLEPTKAHVCKRKGSTQVSFASNKSDLSLKVDVPQLITVEGEILNGTPSSNEDFSPRMATLNMDRYPKTADEDFEFEDNMVKEFGGTDLKLQSYNETETGIVLRMSQYCEFFLMEFAFGRDLNISSDSGDSQVLNDLGVGRKTFQSDRIDELLNLVVDRSSLESAWLTPFVDKVIEMIVSEASPRSVPFKRLLSTLVDGYSTGWIYPCSKIVTDLVSFVVDHAKATKLEALGDLILIILTNRYTNCVEILLERLCSHRLADVINMTSTDLVARILYILTQYIKDSDKLSVLACDLWKLLTSYQPSTLEELSLGGDVNEHILNSTRDSSCASETEFSSASHNESMSKAERDLAQVLKMGEKELKDVLERSSSGELAGKLNWIQFVTEAEYRSIRRKNEQRNDLACIWTESANKLKIESKRLGHVVGKLEVWARGVKEIDAARFANLRQDHLENKHYLEIQLGKRLEDLYRPYSLLSKPIDNHRTYWALDSTEGPSKQRKKLRKIPIKVDSQLAQQPKSRHHRMRSLGTSRRDSYRCEDGSNDKNKRDIEQYPSKTDEIWMGDLEDMTEDETTNAKNNSKDILRKRANSKGGSHKFNQIEKSSHRKAYEDGAPTEDFVEDKFRKICKSLETNDVVQAVWNVEQVIGLDTCPGLFLMAKNNIYIIDGFFQKPDGEIVNSWDAWEDRDPHLRTLASLSKQTAKLHSRAAAHQTRRWAYRDIVSMSPRKWLFRDICIELSFSDGRSRLITFSKTRDEALSRLKDCISKAVGSEVLSNMNVTLKSQTELWQRGKLSNHAYLLYLNDAAGRTYRDLTQHPVFPWILADYTSSSLNLEKPETFRKLALPMGAQTESRKRDFIERYLSLEEFGAIGDERMKPAHYMTHYSSAVVVCGFLIRLQPFCDHFIEIQGSFDHADRTFWSMHRAWLSASEQSRSDVRELTPEFYHCPEFLKNLNNLSLGSRQEGGDPVGDVQLPPWAHGDPRLFVELHREALESDFVSENIHKWIDLIFGYKQRGQAALDAVNVFQEVSYEGTVSLDAIDDERERSSVLGAMCNWGLTPSQIFQTPHPPRGQQAKHAFERRSTITHLTCAALTQSVIAIRDIQQPIGQIHPEKVLDKVIVSGPQSLLVPLKGTHRLDWGFLDQTLRIFDPSGELCATFEGVNCEEISAACFADHRTLVTGSTDSTISLWRFAWLGNGGAHLQQVEVLRGHSAAIKCVSASRTLSIIVSGAEDGLAMVWDLNRALLVHSLPHPTPVSLVAISEGTGDIATCSHNTVRIWSVNGDLLTTLVTTQHNTEPITACCWSKAEVSPLFVTGHQGGKMIFWQRRSVHAENPTDPWKMTVIHVFEHDSGRNDFRGPTAICSLVMTERLLLSGDTLGRLFCWALPGSAYYLPDSAASNCMICNHRFGILDGKRRCVSCSAITCSSCQDIVSGLSGKCCLDCVPNLMKLASSS